MKTAFTTCIAAIGLLVLGATAARAETAPSSPPKELVVVIVGTLTRGAGDFDDYAKVAKVFTEVFNSRGWPVKVRAERFAANNPDYPYEFRIFLKKVYWESRDELVFQAWMTLFDHNAEHEFGMVKYRLQPGINRIGDDVLNDAIRGAAEQAASRVEAILFPRPEKSKI